jgi:hypothetical protein
MISRREELFNSVPEIVKERKWSPEMYSTLCDCFLVSDCDDKFFDHYLRPGGRRVFSPLREAEMTARYELVREVIPGLHCRNDEKHIAMEIAFVACTNLIPVTRRRSRPSLSGPHLLKQNHIAEIASWKLWPENKWNLHEPKSMSGQTEEVPVKPRSQKKR